MFDFILDQANMRVEELLAESEAVDLTREMWNLDPRAFPHGAKVSSELLAVPTSTVRTLDYYGGFEYVEPPHRYTVGSWVVFSTDAERVLNSFNLPE